MEFVAESETEQNTDGNTSQSQAPLNLSEFCGDCEPDQTHLPPVERVVVPGDIVEITPEDESVHIIGTRDGKVTVINGLDHLKKLKVKVLPSNAKYFSNFSFCETGSRSSILFNLTHGGS
jgi:Cys-tRNA synthase (O-phospho-L-seryl-tRNA:Cys-tRNA synthase)